MNRALPGRTFFATAYILLAVGFLTIHFTRVENYSTVVGTMVLKGRSSVGTAASPSQIRRLKINFNGLEVLLRKNDRAVLVTDDGIRHPLNVVEWSQTENTITIDMDNGAGVVLYSDSHGTGTTLTPIIPVTVPPVRSLEIPFRAEGGTTITVPVDRPGTINISMGDKEFIADLPSDSTWDPARKRLNLIVLEKADPVLAISDDARGSGLGAVEWYGQNTIPSETAFNQSLENWMIGARAGWDNRLDPSTGLWKDSSGRAVWNDVLASAMLADSVENGLLAQVLQNVTTIAGSASGDIGWLPSPYLGDIVNLAAVRRNEMQSATRGIVQAAADNSPSFDVPGAMGILIDSNRSEEATRLLNSARNAPSPETENPEILDRLAILRDARILSVDDRENDNARRVGYFDAYILPRIFWVKDGLWLIEDDGSVDPTLSINAGELLLQEAQWNNNSLYQAVGRQLLISALSYADEAGMVPARILFEANGEVLTEGLVEPERLYQTIVQSASYPRHVSLAREMGAGSWALTAAEKFTVRSTPRETTITMDYPSGSIHHLAIKGVKPFNVLLMNGIRWNGDPNFQRYYAGWYYESATETLYVKLRHRTRTENIRILYYDPDVPAEGNPATESGEAETAAAGSTDTTS